MAGEGTRVGVDGLGGVLAGVDGRSALRAQCGEGGVADLGAPGRGRDGDRPGRLVEVVRQRRGCDDLLRDALRGRAEEAGEVAGTGSGDDGPAAGGGDLGQRCREAGAERDGRDEDAGSFHRVDRLREVGLAAVVEAVGEQQDGPRPGSAGSTDPERRSVVQGGVASGDEAADHIEHLGAVAGGRHRDGRRGGEGNEADLHVRGDGAQEGLGGRFCASEALAEHAAAGVDDDDRRTPDGDARPGGFALGWKGSAVQGHLDRRGVDADSWR